jgi:tRNA(His) 5'-end guanylyltransferase
MKFDELDRRMRVFETAHDLCVLPGLRMVARLDGRNFTRLTKETGATVVTTRRRIHRDFDLPMKDEYSRFIASLLTNA